MAGTYCAPSTSAAPTAGCPSRPATPGTAASGARTEAVEFNAYGQAIALAVTLFAIYAALFWWFTQYVDHYAKLPRQADGRRISVGWFRRHLDHGG